VQGTWQISHPEQVEIPLPGLFFDSFICGIIKQRFDFIEYGSRK